MKRFLKNRTVLLAAAAVLATLVAGVGGLVAWEHLGGGGHALGQGSFLAELEAGRIAKATVAGSRIEFTDRDGKPGHTTVLWTEGLRAALAAPGIDLTVQDPDGGALDTTSSVMDVVLKVSMVGFLAVTALLMTNMIRTPARRLARARSDIRFGDVAGVDEARAELAELVDFLKEPARFADVGAAIPKGVLLVGPPGTGKTLLARAVAGEAGVPFFTASGSDFVEMYVGVGAARIRRLFREARKQAPCILFIDEIDALARARSSGAPSGGQVETENTLNQLLAEMDGFARAAGLIVIAATNRVDVLDPAVLRPGRFDRHVFVGLPDIRGRRAILGVHAARVALEPAVDLGIVARATPGMTGADLANLVNEAALLAARSGRRVIRQGDFDGARDRILLGAEKPTVMSEPERRLTAFHEAGHALVALRSVHSDPVHKVTIVPRGRSLGMMVRLPAEDRFCLSRARLETELAVAMGGRAAEELVFGRDLVTTGAAGDIQHATDIATRMVTVWGMSDRFGMVAYGPAGQPAAAAAFSAYGGAALARGGAEGTAGLSAQIAEEVRGLIDAAYDRARTVLAAEVRTLHRLAERLLEAETLEAAEVLEIAGEGIEPEPVPA